jgi:chromosome segregation ATPase
MDWLGWKKTLDLLGANPELIAASAQFGIAVFGVAWALRSHTGKQHVDALETTISDLRSRLADARADLNAATDRQGSMAKEIEKLTQEATRQASTIEQLQKQLDRGTVPPAQLGVQLTLIATGTNDMAITVGNMSLANAALVQSLSQIAHKVEEAEDKAKAPTEVGGWFIRYITGKS